jgi:site-specific recombinase XerD
MTIQQAIDRFVRKRKTEATDRTIRGYRSRLTQFNKWTRKQGIDTIGELTAWHIDEYDMSLREDDAAPTTIKGRMSTINVFLDYCANIGAVDEELSESVDVPNLTKKQEQNQERLAEEDALAALEFFRDSRAYFGVPMHAFLELAWHTGARLGSLKGLDLGDYHSDEQYIEFVHRPSTGTPLKNKHDGERLVGLADPVCDALDVYIDRERSDKRDDHGRNPLFSTRQSRPSFSTLRAWSYQASMPCLWTECPHGRRRESCEYTERIHASKCPSSRSPHRIRTGSITWQLNRGLDIEIVAERVNASPSTIRQHYDQASGQEEFEKRRRAAETALDITDETEEDND